MIKRLLLQDRLKKFDKMRVLLRLEIAALATKATHLGHPCSNILKREGKKCLKNCGITAENGCEIIP